MVNGLERADRGAGILSPRGEAALEQCFHALRPIPLWAWLRRCRRCRFGRRQALELSDHLAQMSVDGIETTELGSGVINLNGQVANQRFHTPKAARLGRGCVPPRGCHWRLLELAKALLEWPQPLGRIETRQGLLEAVRKIRQAGIQSAGGRPRWLGRQALRLGQPSAAA